MEKKRRKRCVCIHGHFYQPPRENPWLEAIEVQDSASPYHDWNERINAECYAPNSRSRIQDEGGRIINIINNYEFMSFDLGPTLLSWMSERAPDVLRLIVHGDRLSCERQAGHGNAMAQVYNHVIMPLAGERDKTTQVRWGVADFQSRFGRKPEGMWLAETAVDTATLEALAAEGIRFTVLARHQAKQCRPLGKKVWTELNGDINPQMPYLCRLPSGKEISLFFYDAGISHAIAFEGILNNGDELYRRLLSEFGNHDRAQLVNVATDGESYGHHHRFGDMALAYALKQLHKDATVEIANYAAFLERYPPQWEVKIAENTSWSCAHGVERWRSDCGCSTGHRGWHQKWRAPFREALDFLKSGLDTLYEREGARCFKAPWAARDAYIDVVLDRGPESAKRFFRRYGKQSVNEEAMVDGLRLLEMQRHGLLMYTSCGWFFDEISGLETVQNLKYACRAVQLAQTFGKDLEEQFVRILQKAPSNVPEYGDGAGVWRKAAKPAMVDLERVLAHYAIGSIYREKKAQDKVYCFDITCHDTEVITNHESALAVGRISASSRLTLEEKNVTFVVLRFGSVDFHCALRPARTPKEYAVLKGILFKSLESGSVADVYQAIAREFPEKIYRLKDLFAEEQRRLIEIGLRPRLEEYDEVFEKLVAEDENVIKFLVSSRYPVPQKMFVVLSNTLDRQLIKAAQRLPSAEALGDIRNVRKRAQIWDYRPQSERLGLILAQKLEETLNGLKADADAQPVLDSANEILDVATTFEIKPDLWRLQNALLDFCSQSPKPVPRNRKVFEDFALRIGLSPGILRWVDWAPRQ